MADVTYTGQIVREAPEIEAYKLGLLQEAQRLYNEQPLNLPAYEAAGLSQSQLQAADLAKQGIGAYEPYIQAGSGALTQGQNLSQAASKGIAGINTAPQFQGAQAGIQQAMQTVGGALTPDFRASQGYLTQAGQMAQSNLTPDYQRAGSYLDTAGQMAQSSMPDFMESRGYLGSAGQMAAGATGAYDPRSVSAYMNPYQQEVTQNTMRELQRQGAIQQQGLAAQAVRSGAFGGMREGVQRAEMDRNLSDVMARQIAQDYAQNYQQAQQAAMQGYEAQQQRGLAAANQFGQLGAQYGQQAATEAQLGQAGAGLMSQIGAQYGQQATNAAQLGQAGAGIMSQIGSQLGQQAATGTQLQQSAAGLQGQLAQGIGSLAAQQAGIDLSKGQALGQLGQNIGSMGVQQAALGQLQSQLGAQDVSLLSQIGAQEQQNAQAQLDAMRATDLQRTMSPYQQLGFVSDIYKGAPTSQMALTSQSAPSASPMQQFVGTAVGGLSTAAGVNKLFG